MFKQASVADELLRSMEKTLVKNQAEKNTHQLTRLAQAVDYLNDAAAIFERAGMTEEADLITDVLQALSKSFEHGDQCPKCGGTIESKHGQYHHLQCRDCGWAPNKGSK